MNAYQVLGIGILTCWFQSETYELGVPAQPLRTTLVVIETGADA